MKGVIIYDLLLSLNSLTNEIIILCWSVFKSEISIVISRELINYLKIERGVDAYVPLRNNMTAFYDAVGIAKREKMRYNGL